MGVDAGVEGGIYNGTNLYTTSYLRKGTFFVGSFGFGAAGAGSSTGIWENEFTLGAVAGMNGTILELRVNGFTVDVEGSGRDEVGRLGCLLCPAWTALFDGITTGL